MNNFQTSNYLQSNSFILVIPSFEKTRFLATQFQIPGIDLPTATADSPFSRMNFAGDKLDYQMLDFEFIVDEEMKNFTEIHFWLTSIAYPTSFQDYTDYPLKNQHQRLGEQDIKIIVLNSKNNPVKTFTFHNAIPMSLSGLPMQSTVNEVDYVRCNVVFAYDYYTIENS